jgi:hypothetical protein
MTVIEKLGARLGVHPQLRVEGGKRWLRVLPARLNGFVVEMEESGGRIEVRLDGWRERFRDPDEAVECFLFGLCRDCRIRVHSAGKRDFRWTLQYRHGPYWISDTTRRSLLRPFWRRRSVRYLRNDLIEPESTA